VGGGGIILHTEDGGHTWVQQAGRPPGPLHQESETARAANPSSPPSQQEQPGVTRENQQQKGGIPPPTYEALLSVSFATPQSAWAVGTKGAVLHTDDGGKTWTTQTSGADNALYYVAFATPQSGWQVGEKGAILHTDDGGKTWKTQTSGVQVWLNSVAFATPQLGWAVGGKGVILHTDDGGQTWKTQTSGADTFLSSVAFATPQSGWVVGEKGVILHTEDGGQTWKTQTSGADTYLNSVAFATPQSGWVVGEKGAILHTENGGQTWQAQTSGANTALYFVAFVTSQSGWAVGDKGVIVHTEDGGKIWKKQTSGVQVWLNSLAFATPQSVWVVGDLGTVIHSEDGGETWKKVFELPEKMPELPWRPKIKTGQIEENQKFKSSGGKFSITAPAARNPFVRIYDFRESRLKYDNYDYEEVIFQIGDMGQAYGAGVRRLPQFVLEQMAKEEPKQTLSNLANKALYQWRDNYSEEPQPVDEAQVKTQFGEGLFRIYIAKRSSILGRVTGRDEAGKPKLEPSDARIAVLVVKKGDLFIYATAEDEYSKMVGSTPADLRKQLETFFTSMTVKLPE
jgi:photosystem II stability/assembly factor-like uncharacterized protein